MSRGRIDWTAVILIAAVLALWFGTLDYRTLIRPDEGRYAEIPREMVHSGDWITPRLNAIKYFEKPALQYWATAAAYTVFGEHHWTARLWPAITGFGGILLAAFLGTRLWGLRAGIVAGAMLGGTLIYNFMGHIVTLDMSLTFFLQLALTGFILAQQAETSRASRHWIWLAWGALGLAMLSKGLVALVLTGMTVVLYSLLNRDWGAWKRLSPVSGLTIFLAIAAPWFVAVSLRNPEFPHFFFIHEHFERFLTQEHRRYQPSWYFLSIYAAGALPFVFLYLHGMLKAWGTRIAGQFNPERFLVIWVVATFAFFSLSSSKLPPYILPIFPALALLGGKVLTTLSRRALTIHLSVLALITLLAVAFGSRFIAEADDDYSTEMVEQIGHWLIAAAVVWTLGLLASLALLWKHCKPQALIVLSACGFFAGTCILLGHDVLAPFKSAYDSAQKIRPLLTPGVPFYSVRWYEQTLPYYIKRPVTLVAYKDEMAFGIKQEPDKWIPTFEEFKRRWLTDQDAFAMVSIETFDELKSEHFPMQEIARDQRNVYIRKTP